MSDDSTDNRCHQLEAENQRLCALLERWARLEVQVFTPVELTHLFEETRRALGPPSADGDGKSHGPMLTG
jgi:hypothetical protein